MLANQINNTNNENEIKVVPPCKGRAVVKENDRKWYLHKEKSQFLYTCCEECYVNNIKGTVNEDKYFEYITDDIGNCMCDYLLYETDCNYEDCSITKNNLRISVVDETGKRCKLDKTGKYDKNITTFLLKNNNPYSLLVENVNGSSNGPNKYLFESSKISMNSLRINNKDMDCSYLFLSELVPFFIETFIENGIAHDQLDDDNDTISDVNSECTELEDFDCTEDYNLNENDQAEIDEEDLDSECHKLAQDEIKIEGEDYNLNENNQAEIDEEDLDSECHKFAQDEIEGEDYNCTEDCIDQTPVIHTNNIQPPISVNVQIFTKSGGSSNDKKINELPQNILLSNELDNKCINSQNNNQIFSKINESHSFDINSECNSDELNEMYKIYKSQNNNSTLIEKNNEISNNNSSESESDNNENNENISNTNNLIVMDDEIVFSVSKYNQIDTIHISEIPKNDIGTYNNAFSIPSINVTDASDVKYRAVMGINLYSTQGNDATEFSILVKRVSEDYNELFNESSNNIDNDVNKENQFNISI